MLEEPKPWIREAGPLRELCPEGELRGGVPFRLYYLVAATRATGALMLCSPQGAVFELFFRKGAPELARSDAPGLDLGAFLVAKGVIDARGLIVAEAVKGDHGGELLNALFAKGFLAPGMAFPLLAEYARTILDRALALEAGTFHWDPKATAPAAAFPLGDRWDLLCGAGRRVDAATVRRRLGSRVDLPVMRAGDGTAGLEDLRLTAQERRIVASLDGTRCLADLVAAHPAETEAILGTVWFLSEVGLASFATTAGPQRPVRGPESAPDAVSAPPVRPAVAPPASVAPNAAGVTGPQVLTPAARPEANVSATPGPVSSRPAVAPSPSARPIPTGATAPPVLTRVAPPEAKAAASAPVSAGADPSLPTDLAGVEAYLASLDGKDHFAVLGVQRAASPAQIKAAYFRLARVFHPDTVGAGGDNGMRHAKHAITARLNEAYQVLSDGAKRTEYLQALEAGPGVNQMDVAAILAAEERFSWATVRVKARRFAEALPALEQAVELNPREGEFYAWRGYVRFVLATDPKAMEARAMADLHRALELSPKCAVAWLFSARIAAALGYASRAANAYRKCLALDASNIDAQRELRLLEGRGKK